MRHSGSEKSGNNRTKCRSRVVEQVQQLKKKSGKAVQYSTAVANEW